MSREVEYNEYIDNHVNNVIESWDRFLKPALLFNKEKLDINVNELKKAQYIIKNHDGTKWSTEEYRGYLNKFYPEETTNMEQAQIDFDCAWLHHQNTNPHHWQYYVLINGEGEAKLLDLPFEYICEMICDWHSFSAKDSTSTAYNWYKNNKNKMMLSSNTREVVEKLIKYMKNPL